MNREKAVSLMGGLLLIGGCSAPKNFTVEGEGRQQQIGGIQKQAPLVRTEAVAQLQVDAAAVYRQMIEFFTQNADGTLDVPVLKNQKRVSRLEAELSFKPGSTELQVDYKGNRMELDKLRRDLQGLTDKGGELQQVHITGYASPDGSTVKNEELAVGRALRFRRYLSQQIGLSEQKIIVEQCAEDWDGLKRLVEEAHKPYSAQVTSVLAKNTDPDARRKALRALNGGKSWKDMEQTLFAHLRRMQLDVEYVSTERVEMDAVATQPDIVRLITAFDERPEAMTQKELLTLAEVYRPGTEQYREIYELVAYRFTDSVLAQLNAGAAALVAGDSQEARFFLERVQSDPRSWINLGVLALQEGNNEEAVNWFRKAMPIHPAKARYNLKLVKN